MSRPTSARAARTACIPLVILLLIGCGGQFAQVARADGDPASDVLLTEYVFYPYSPAVSSGLAGRLNGATAEARTAGYPIKVALIASTNDLGAAAVLFGRPQTYAQFLGSEIREVAPYQLLLVVMPTGYGVSTSSAAAQRAVAGLAKPQGTTSDDLARAAILAVPKLAAAAGHPLKSIPDLPVTSTSPGGSKPPAIAILVLGALLIAAAIVIVRARRGGRL
jgi:hypothetical protein